MIQCQMLSTDSFGLSSMCLAGLGCPYVDGDAGFELEQL